MTFFLVVPQNGDYDKSDQLSKKKKRYNYLKEGSLLLKKIKNWESIRSVIENT